ncbi:MAG TPA: hypothetical protein VFP89_11485 [Propionibacteriaceae bacterium]|nr:hypothetical protein [Propionibacteriaceae bacterium]
MVRATGRLEVEPGRAAVPATELPAVPPRNQWDDPQQLGALVDTVRWGTVASADFNTLQASVPLPHPDQGLPGKREI